MSHSSNLSIQQSHQSLHKYIKLVLQHTIQNTLLHNYLINIMYKFRGSYFVVSRLCCAHYSILVVDVDCLYRGILSFYELLPTSRPHPNNLKWLPLWHLPHADMKDNAPVKNPSPPSVWSPLSPIHLLSGQSLWISIILLENI